MSITATYEVRIDYRHGEDEMYVIASVDVDETVFGPWPIADVIAEAVRDSGLGETFKSATLLARVDRTKQIALAV